MRLTEGQERAERIIKEEMLRAGAAMAQARERDFNAWLAAHNQLCELGRVWDVVRGETPSLEFPSGAVEVTTIKEYGLTQQLSFSIRCF